MDATGAVALSGRLGMKVTRGNRVRSAGVVWHLRNWLTNRLREVPQLFAAFVARGCGLTVVTSCLRAIVKHADGSITDFGVISRRVVTDAGVGFIVDAFQNSVELENMKYHGYGTGTNNEAAGDTALQTELTTQYATDNTRPTGTTTEGATANIYRTVATLSPDASVAITEHGVFSQASNAGGVLLDRSKFSAINLVSGDSLQTTYELTFTSGS